MTNENFKKILDKYENTDQDYFNFLFRLILCCHGDFKSLLEEAERINKKLYLIKDTQAEMEKAGLMPESFVLIEDIGMK